MERHKAEILIKLCKRREMFEDYVALIKKQAGGKSGPPVKTSPAGCGRTSRAGVFLKQESAPSRGMAKGVYKRGTPWPNKNVRLKPHMQPDKH